MRLVPVALPLLTLGLRICGDADDDHRVRAPASSSLPGPPAPTSASPSASPSAAGNAPATSGASPPASLPAAPADCPDGMVAIPPTGPGGFVMGRGDRGASDRPHKVVLTKGYCMDATEVTTRAYAACVEARACRLPFMEDRFATYPRKPDDPVNMVSWDKARAYCAWAGKRLPTEAEWEWAASGPEHTKYPWGDGPEPACGVGLADFTPLGAPKTHAGGDVGCFGGGPSRVGSHAAGKRVWPTGALFDLAGNVWEWTEDSYAPYEERDQIDPLVRLPIANHAIRGGGWNRPPRALTTYFRGSAVYTYQVPALGFRCVKGAPHPAESPG